MSQLKTTLHHCFVKYPRFGYYGYQCVNALKNNGELISLLQHLCKQGLQPQSILDVGANRSEWSQVASRIFTKTAFFLIEPQEEMRPFLQRFTASLGYGSDYFIAGAGSKKGTLDIAVWDDFSGSSFFAANNEASNGKEMRTVPVIEIDDLIHEGKIIAPDLIKLDVQGFELEVLKGATDCLKHCTVIIMEVSFFRFFPNTPLFHEVVAFMEQHNFLPYQVLHQRHRPLDGAPSQIDVCFVKEDSFLRSSNKWI